MSVPDLAPDGDDDDSFFFFFFQILAKMSASKLLSTDFLTLCSSNIGKLSAITSVLFLYRRSCLQLLCPRQLNALQGLSCADRLWYTLAMLASLWIE